MRKQSKETVIATAPAMLVVRVRLFWKLMTCLGYLYYLPALLRRVMSMLRLTSCLWGRSL